MKRALQDFRSEWFDKAFKPTMILVVFNIIYCVYSYFIAKNSPAINLVMCGSTTLIAVCWALVRIRFKPWAMLAPYLWLIVNCINLNLLFRDQVHPALQIADK
jgi:hypothetical protein